VVTEYETKLNHKITPEQKKKQIGVDSFRLQAFPGFELIMEKYAKSKFGKGHVAFAHAPSVYRAMITGKPYPVMALISAASNPLVTQANSKLVYQAIKNLDLYVVVDLWRTPSAELADYVFPAACWLERPVFHTWSDTFGFVDCGEQAMPARVEGEYDRRPDYAFWSGLGNRLGQERNWPWKTLEEAFDDRLKPMGVTFKELCEKGGYTSWPKEEKNTKRSALAPPPARRNSIPRFSSNSAMNPCRSFTNPLKAPIAAPTSAGNIP
jgi:anaerobic selenocysteine-containing dehydrogenase